MACENQVSLQPFISNAFVECARDNKIILLFTYRLRYNQLAIDSIDACDLAVTYGNFAIHVVDGYAFDWRRANWEGETSNELEAIEVPDEDLAVGGTGNEGGKGARGSHLGDWLNMAKEALTEREFCYFMGQREFPDGYDTVRASRDKSLRIMEDCAREGSLMGVFEEGYLLSLVSMMLQLRLIIYGIPSWVLIGRLLYCHLQIPNQDIFHHAVEDSALWESSK